MEKDQYALIDCRVSDPAQLKGGSLQDQEVACMQLAEKNGWKVDKVLRKPHSATTTERDDFDDACEYIKKRRAEGINITKYICKAIDRFTRMGTGEYINLKNKLETIGVDLVDVSGIIQAKRNSLEHLPGNFKYDWSMYSPSEGGELLAAHESKQEVRKILMRMVGAEIKLVQDGFSVRRAPDGLQNKTGEIDDTKKKIVREADPARVQYLVTMFDMLAEGMDYNDVVERLNAMGYRTRVYKHWDRSDKEHPKVFGTRGGNPLTVKQLQRTIEQTEYAGVNYEKWTRHRPVKMQYFDGIVTIDTFNRANRGRIFIIKLKDGTVEIEHNYSLWGKVKRLRDNPKYPWKCILCPSCGSEFLASPSTGKSGKKFEAYHCGAAKGKRAHKYFRVKQIELEKTVRVYLDSLKFKKGFMAGLELHLLNKYRQRESEILVESSSISRNVADLKAELAGALSSFQLAQTDTMRRMLEQRVNELDEQVHKAEKERGRIEINEKNIRNFRQYAEYIMEHPGEILTAADNLRSRRALMSLFFVQPPTYDAILSGTPKLQPLFTLSEDFKANKSYSVTLPGIEPGFKA